MQIREVVERFVAAGGGKPGDPGIVVVLDAGYDAPRTAHLLDGRPVEILGRLRSDRVMRRPAPSREEFHLANRRGGRPPEHGREFVFGDPTTGAPNRPNTVTGTRLFEKATAQAWEQLHPRLTRRAAWLDREGPPPIVEGTVTRLVVQMLPSGGINKPV
ncbi:transposase [Streptomyces levis]|uniref:transposase n=1 Tax=Streptomyces levis TaxID=285566 RepID=UPI003C7D5F72